MLLQLALLGSLMVLFIPVTGPTGKLIRGIPFIASLGILSLQLRLGFGIRRDGFRSPIRLILWMIPLGLVTAGLSALFFQPLFPVYVASDLLQLVWLVVCIVLLRELTFLKGIRKFRLFYGLSVLIFVSIALFGGSAVDLIAYCTILAAVILMGSRLRLRGGLLISVAGALLSFSYQGYWSGRYRAHLLAASLVSLLALTLALTSYRGGLKRLVLGSAMVMGVGAAAVVLVADTDLGSYAQSVFSTDTYSTDASWLQRWNEANYVLSLDRPWPSRLIGYGHGAVYPSTTDVELPPTHGEYFHAIHIGPVLLFYRYGVFGLLLYLSFLQLAVRGFRASQNALAAQRFAAKPLQGSAILLLSSYLMFVWLLVIFHSQNVLILPIFGICLGALVTLVPLYSRRARYDKTRIQKTRESQDIHELSNRRPKVVDDRSFTTEV